MILKSPLIFPLTEQSIVRTGTDVKTDWQVLLKISFPNRLWAQELSAGALSGR